MSMRSLAWSVLVVLIVSSHSSGADTIVKGGNLEIGLDAKSGLPVSIEVKSDAGRAWLRAPVSLELKNLATDTAASPTKLQRHQGAFAGSLEALGLTMISRWTASEAALQWNLKFEGDGKRVEHCLVIDLPVLTRSDRVFAPTQRGVMDVAAYPDYTPAEYARYDWNGAEGYVLPLVSVLDPATDSALTVALPADDNIPHLQVEWHQGRTLRLTMARRGMGGRQPTEVSLLFLTHAADYRAVLKAYSDLFPRYFQPGLPRGPYEGTFYYHHIQEHPDYAEMARQHVRFLWSSFWFTHLGEYLPQEQQWHPYTYAKWWKRGEVMSDDRINAFIEEMHEHKIGTYAYFNVTEYGGYGGKEGNAEEAGRRLREQFADALMKTADGNNIRTWEGAMAMNPGADYSLRRFLRQQVRRHLQRIPDFEGFVIDRLDWASKIDYGHSDGLTMIGDRAVENMAVPVADAVREVCRMSHAAGKRVFVNQFWRVEVLRDTDGVCHEADPLPLLGYATPLRPASAWHQRVGYDGDLLPFEAQLKRRLHWALFPQMIAHEFPISQQRANSRAADLLEIYAPLFDTLLGKRQVLESHCVTVDGANQANLFINGAGHTVVPVTSSVRFLCREARCCEPATVTIKTEAARNLEWAHVYSADGPPCRARLSPTEGGATVVVERHGTASVVVAGRGPEPALQDEDAVRIAQTRRHLFPPNNTDTKLPQARSGKLSLPAKIKHYVLTVRGEHVGSDDSMRVLVNGEPVGTLPGNQGRFRWAQGGHDAPRVELYAGNEGVWFVPEELSLLAICSNEKLYRVAYWTRGGPLGYDRNFTGRLWIEMSACEPEECTLPVCKYVGKQIGTGGRWRGRLGTLAVWIPNVTSTEARNGYRLQVSGQAYTWNEEAQNDARVLEAPGEEALERAATCWHADSSLRLRVAPPDDRPYRLTLYVLDYDRHGRAADAVWNLDKVQAVTPDETGQGVYLTWSAQGTVELELNNKKGQNVVLSGVFVDPQE